MRNRTCILLSFLFLCSCSEYQKILKSTDPDIKYEYALRYFGEGKYVRSQTLLDEVAPYYRGTERSQEVMIYLARSFLGQKNYSSAAEYYEAYTRNYPKGRYAVEAYYQLAHCYYLDAPDARLEQEITRKAIASYQQFIELFPTNDYADVALKEMNELYDQLAYKELLSAKLYYNLGTYLGNNYLSSEITAKNALKDYPSNKYQEELSWYIFASKYQQMVNSVETKKDERARDAEDEYYSFTTEYPDSKHKNAAERMLKDIRKITRRKK